MEMYIRLFDSIKVILAALLSGLNELSKGEDVGGENEEKAELGRCCC